MLVERGSGWLDGSGWLGGHVGGWVVTCCFRNCNVICGSGDMATVGLEWTILDM